MPDQFHIYTFEEFSLDTRRNALKKNGREVKLRPQSFDVLKILVREHGTLVTKERLHKEIWDKKIVTDDSLTHCLLDIRKALGDSEKIKVRTLPRRGYIFELPCTKEASNSVTPETPKRIGKFNFAGIAAGIGVMVVGLVWLLGGFGTTPFRTPPNDAIAVLPFADLSESQDQQYLGDGISDGIISMLSISPDLNVIARTSTFSFRETRPDIAAIREKLNVAYVLEGSAKRINQRLVVTAQLVDANTGVTIRSLPFNEPYQELETIQRDIATAVLLEIAPSSAELIPTVSRRNFTADEFMFLARRYEKQVRELPEVEDDIMAEAIGFYRDAIQADPQSALAHSRLAGALMYAGDIEAAEEPTFEAIRLNPDLSEVQETLGRYKWLRGMPGAGDAWERAVDLNPNNADALSGYAYWHMMQGDNQRPEPLFRRALALDPISLARHAALGEYLAHTSKIDATMKVVDEIEKKFDSAASYRVIARLLELTGQLDVSIVWAIKARDLEPTNSDHTGALAELYAEIGDFETAMRLEPIHGAGLLFKMGRYDELIEVAEIGVIDEPHDLYLRHLLAFAYNVNGNAKAAIRMLHSMGQPDVIIPEARQAVDIEAFLTYIDALDAVGDTARARRLAEWFYKKPHVESDNWWIHIYLACTHSILENDQLALEELERVGSSPRLPWNSVLQDSRCFSRYQEEPRYRAVLQQVESRRAQIRNRLAATLEKHAVSL